MLGAETPPFGDVSCAGTLVSRCWERTVTHMRVLQRGLRSQVRKLAPRLLRDSFRLATDDDVLLIDWVNRGPVRENWGDAIAPVIAGRLSGRPVVNHRDTLNVRRRTLYTTIGSMFGTIDVDGFEVWGTGFVDSRAELSARPGRIHAVRGPLTYRKLRDAGVDCPELFGDPALLFPRLHPVPTTGEFALGIIPHFKEIGLPAVAALREAGAHIIDIRSSTTGVVEEIGRCRTIASSSLHGLVAADAYGVPAIWVRFSDHPGGDGFKFRDYLASTESRAEEPLFVGTATSVAEIEDRFGAPPAAAQLSALADALLAACPFLDPSRVRSDGSIV